MKRQALSIKAESAPDLRKQLAAHDITVPHITEGRTAQHRETYTVARFLASFAEDPLLRYPIRVEHRDKPDFVVTLADRRVGIECVEAVPEEWYEISAIRERHFPEALVFGQIFHPGQKRFSKEEKWAIASGERKGPPWAGDMAERSWAEAMEYFVKQKTAKLRAGNYREFQDVWLLVQDEWRAPVYHSDELTLAVSLAAARIAPLLVAPSYSRVIVCRNSTIVTFTEAGTALTPVVDLWR